MRDFHPVARANDQPPNVQARFVPSNRPPGGDTTTFEKAGYPTEERNVTRLATGAYMRFKTVEDQSACVVTMCDSSDGVSAVAIDASGCEHESRIFFEIPNTSGLISEASRGSVLRVQYQVIGRLLTSSDPPIPPIRELSLFEYDKSGAEQSVYKIQKKIPLADESARRSVTHEFTRELEEAGHYEFGFRIVPKAAPFCISMASARVLRVYTANCDVQQIGKRIQGKFPAAPADPKLVVQRGESRTVIPLDEDYGVHLAHSRGFAEFDVCTSRLSGFVPTEDSRSGAFVSLSIGCQLVAGCECVIPSKEDAMTSAELYATADDDEEILAAAEYELRRSRNSAALALLDRLTGANVSHQRTAGQLRMRALVNERRFEEAIALFESIYPRMEHDTKAYSRYVEACASSRQHERARAELEKVASRGSPEMLARLYRYSSLLPDPYRSVFAERLLAVAGELRSHMKSIIHVGHDFAKRGNWPGIFQVVTALEGFDLNDTEKARLALLMAQVEHELGHVSQFLERLNEALRRLKVQPISLSDSKMGFLLSNVTAQSTPTDSNGPLVSVLMTSFNSESTIGYAMNSVLAQSHSNLELLVVDDCSEDRSREIIANTATRDSRVIPIFPLTNAGTYVCKNIALGRARGEYITCQDSDDWAHPHKIETCVRRLHKDRSLVATGVKVVRFSPKDGLQFRRDYLQPDAASLMYRAEPVRRSLGFYDSVRVAADTEFERRMKLTFGPKAVRYVQEVLTLALWSDTTLTGGRAFAIDNDTGVHARPRNAYRREFVRWHERADRLYIDFPLKRRPFPAPEEILSATI